MKYSVYFFFILTLLYSCSPQLKKIPEVSPHIAQENLYKSSIEQITEKLFAVNSHLVYFTKQGQVIKFDPHTRTKTEVVSLGNGISSRISSTFPYVLLQTRKTKSYIVFNLNSMGIHHQFNYPQIHRIVGLDNQFIYHYKNKQLSVFDYFSGKTVKKRTIRQKIHHCEIRQNNVYILSTKRLYIYDKSRQLLKDYPLGINASSPFLLEKKNIYFGSTNRQLVRFSLKTKKIKWKFKLTQILTEKPLLMNRYIVVTPEDHTICYFTPGGTLTWWAHLGNRRIGSPIVMKDNIALFLPPRSHPEVIFVNIKKKNHVTNTCDTPLLGDPVAIKEFIYFLSPPPKNDAELSKPESIQLNRIGNIYKTEVTTKPEKIKDIGKTIRFELKPINMIRPEHHIRIYDSQKQLILEKKIKWNDKSRFVWIPQKVGTYSLSVKSNSQNISNIHLEKNIEIIDAQKILNDHYLHVQQICETAGD